MSATATPAGLPAPLHRASNGRWLAGVCAGLAPPRALKVGWVRLAFLAAVPLGGLGLVAYAALWLILPVDGAPVTPAAERRGLVVVAQACAACAGLAALAFLGAVATIFGFGWAVVALGAGVLVGVLGGWRRAGPAAALLPIAALTLPAVAVSAAGLKLTPQTRSAVVAPRTFTGGTYRSGLGTLLVDLRTSALPASGVVPLRIEAGVRRTIVALPADRCVRVRIAYHVTPFLGRMAALLTGRPDRPFSALVVFGVRDTRLQRSRVAVPAPSGAGPVLSIDFSSMGGSLYVRDYPERIDPDVIPDWPGYAVTLEPRPDTTGVPRRAAAALIRSWRARLAVERRSQQLVNRLLPGPCAGGGTA